MKSPSKKKTPRSFIPKGRELSKKRKIELSSKVFEILKKENPDPKCELYYLTPFQLLVSVVLSAQTTDKMVNRVMEPLYNAGFDVDDVIKMGSDGLLEKIRQIGLAPTKSKNVLKLSIALKEKHNSEVPSDRESLEALAGVGKKTASVILGELFDAPVMAVDTHVYRVSKRLGLHRESDASKTEDKILEIVERRYLPKAHHWFVLQGRYICKSQRPLCEECLLTELCPTYKNGERKS